MSEKTEHTTIPWAYELDADGRFAIYGGQNPRQRVCTTAWREIDEDERDNAEFIVRACNSYYDLLAACELGEDLTRTGLAPGSGDLTKLQAAIAKAKGQS